MARGSYRAFLYIKWRVAVSEKGGPPRANAGGCRRLGTGRGVRLVPLHAIPR